MSGLSNELMDEFGRGVSVAVMMKVLFGKASIASVFSSDTLMTAGKFTGASLAYKYVGRPVVRQITGAVGGSA